MLVSNIDRLLASAWCFLSVAFAINRIPPPSLPVTPMLCGVRANLYKTTTEVTNPVCVGLHAGDAGWRVLQDIRLHTCLKTKVRYMTWAFWLGFDGFKQVEQVSRSP